MSIIATTDLPALATYMKNGVYPRFPIYYFAGEPQTVQFESDLAFQRIQGWTEAIETLAELDLAVLGHRRDIDHEWLLGDRPGFLYLREGEPVGYGYTPGGPCALLDKQDFPAVLLHTETFAAEEGHRHFGVQVPMANTSAIDHLLNRGFRMDDFITSWMSDR